MRDLIQRIISEQITVPRSKGFYDIDSLMTIYTNKIIEHPLPGISEDYHLAKTKWHHDTELTHYDLSDITTSYFGNDYGYDYHLFQIGDNGEIYKIIHPSYFKYYGYYLRLENLDIGFWETDLTEREIYIYAYNGLLRDGEYIYSDTTIVTQFADYYIEKFYEVEYDSSVTIPFKKVTYTVRSLGDTICIDQNNWSDGLDHPDVNIALESNYKKYCPPADTLLKNTYKIINTRLITMIGTGLEFGFRNTIWLGSAGTRDPLGIVKDQLEIRWSEPYWEEYGSGWYIISRLELTTLRKNNDGVSRLFDIFNYQSKHLSISQIGNEIDNDPYKYSPIYGLHRLWIPDEK